MSGNFIKTRKKRSLQKRAWKSLKVREVGIVTTLSLVTTSKTNKCRTVWRPNIRNKIIGSFIGTSYQVMTTSTIEPCVFWHIAVKDSYLHSIRSQKHSWKHQTLNRYRKTACSINTHIQRVWVWKGSEIEWKNRWNLVLENCISIFVNFWDFISARILDWINQASQKAGISL